MTLTCAESLLRHDGVLVGPRHVKGLDGREGLVIHAVFATGDEEQVTVWRYSSAAVKYGQKLILYYLHV